TDLPDTTLIAGYVQKFQDRTDGDGNIGKFSKTFGTGSGASGVSPEIEDGAFTVAAINKSIAGLTLTAAYAQANDLKGIMDRLSIAYAEADYQGKAGSFSYGLAAQYYYNDFGGNDTTYDANNLWATKVSLGYDAFGAYVAYSKVNDKTNGLGVVSGLGGGADLAYTGSPIMSSSYENDTEAYKVGATYAIMKNANVGVSYTVNDIDSTDYKAAFAAIEADYAFEGALKGLSTAVIYEDGSKDASGKSAMRLNLNYKF
ncbi:MAG: porin, partial [Campylobacterales bacterium]|nr:porin [Campylobacterales bacterium]